MSIQWMNRVWQLSTQKGSLLLAELAIADNANDAGVAWPGLETLARKTRLSERNVNRMTSKLESSQELTIYHGGMGRRSTNIYVMLLGRDPAEIDTILKMLKQKHVNLSTLKGGQFVMVDKLSMTKKRGKVDTAMSTEPLRTNDHVMYEWMKDDPICQFLKTLPGFNVTLLESTRREIVAHHYEQGELPYLWNECALADNPIGLFTYKVTNGQHSVDWQMLQMQQSEETNRKIQNEVQLERTEAELEWRKVNSASIVCEPDESVTDKISGYWQLALGELQLEMTRATFETWVKPAILLSVNGTWKIGISNDYSKDWLDRRLRSTIERILTGITGHAVKTQFVVMK